MKFSHVYVFIIFISLTMAAAAALVPRYTKPGCTYMCGNVRIPYPFGIGVRCSLNQWYAVDCNSSTPYLTSVNKLEVLSIDLNDQMVLVKLPMTSGCHTLVWNSSQILNVGRDNPYLFSKKHNKFMVEGCGSAEISSRGNVLTGCATSCSQQSASSKRNSCQTNIPYYLETYTVNINQTVNKSCLSALLVADNSYVKNQSVDWDNSLVLRWTLTDDDINQGGCGPSFNRHQLNTSNNSSVSTGTCGCLYEIQQGNPYLSGGDAKLPKIVTSVCIQGEFVDRNSQMMASGTSSVIMESTMVEPNQHHLRLFFWVTPKLLRYIFRSKLHRWSL